MIVRQARLPLHFPLGDAGDPKDRRELEAQAEAKILKQVVDAGWEPIPGTLEITWTPGNAIGYATVMAQKEGDE